MFLKLLISWYFEIYMEINQTAMYNNICFETEEVCNVCHMINFDITTLVCPIQ